MDEKDPLLPKDNEHDICHLSEKSNEIPAHQTPIRSRKPPTITQMLLLLVVAAIGAYVLYQSWSISDDSASASAIDTTKHKHLHHITQVADLPSHLLPSKHNERRLLIVGDVHGCRKSLEHLLKKTTFDSSKDHLILTGDMINKGPDTHGVIKLARKLGASAVRGNHEDKCLALRNLQDSGVQVTDESSTAKMVEDAGCASDLTHKDVEWLSQAPLILKLGNLTSMPHAATAVIVHAGLVPGISLEDQDPFAVMHMRSISRAHRKNHKQKDKGKFVPEEGRNDGEPWYKIWNSEQQLLKKGKKGVDHAMIVIYGHDSKRGLNERKWSIGLDSGCVNGDRLSGLLIDHHKATIVNVDCQEAQ